MNNAPPAIAVQGASKCYGSTQVLAPLDLVIASGERVALVGPSGAGKTTLLRMIAGAVEPSSGSLLLHGQPLAGLPAGRDLSRLVGMVAQQFDLVPNLSALHNVLAGRLGEWSFFRSLVSLVWPRDRDLALQALERVGVADLAYQRAGRLSGGEQQRVAIARVLVQDPRIVLADEPVASLDPARAEEVLRLLVAVTAEEGETLVASVHAVDLARRHFGRAVGLRDGVVEFDLPTSDLTEAMLADLYQIEDLSGAI